MLLQLNLKPKVDVSRIGSCVQTTSQDSTNRKPRPVKVTVASSAIVKEVLSRAKCLKNCSGYRGVSISPDCSVEQRAEQSTESLFPNLNRDWSTSRGNGILLGGIQ